MTAGVLSKLRTIAELSILTAGATVLYLLLFGAYASDSSFAPQSDQNDLAQLAGIAAQFGVNVGQQSGQSVDFYEALLDSRQLLENVATSSYHVYRGDGTLTGTWLDLMGVRGDTPQERLLNGVDKLRDDISVTSSVLSGTVSIRVVAPYPDLAEQVNRRVLDLVNTFNIQMLQSQANAQRRFVDSRLAQAEKELLAAEDAMRRFLEVNRTYQSSPRLMFEYGALQRTIDVKQQVYLTLSQSDEQARIDEVRNTPVITVIDRPEGSSKPAHDPVIVGPVVFGLTAVLMAALFMGLEFARSTRARSAESYEALRNAVLESFGAAGKKLDTLLERFGV